MNKILEELRDVNSELEELRSRKEAIKKKALEHRSTIPTAEQKQYRAEAEKIKQQIAEKETRLAELRAQAEKFEEGENNMNNEILHFKEGMERADIFATAEYRSAYFKKMQGKDLSDAEKRSITSATNSGGAAIPTHTMNMILGQLKESNGLLSLITLTNIPELISYPVENVVNDAAWVSEGTKSEPSNDSLKALSLSAYSLIKTIEVTAKLQKMSVDAFEAWIVNAITRKMKLALSKSVISGSGVNQPTGLNSSTWDETNSVEGEVTYDNLVDVEALVGEEFIVEAVWVMNRKTKAKVQKLKDDQKRPLFERAVEDGFVGYLLGYPVKLDSSVADDEAYLGDWKSAYVMNLSQDVEYAKSGEAGFMSGSTIYRGLALADGKPTGVKGAMAKLKKAVK
ncbi:MAG: phage major capsid protein [Clostridia bacterium]|nr:phage major capsid protein [Clostridia bacterium]